MLSQIRLNKLKCEPSNILVNKPITRNYFNRKRTQKLNVFFNKYNDIDTEMGIMTALNISAFYDTRVYQSSHTMLNEYYASNVFVNAYLLSLIVMSMVIGCVYIWMCVRNIIEEL